MYEVFLSYRRQESGGHAAMLYAALRDRFGSRRVFMDTTRIEAGKQWPIVIDEALAACRVVVVVIGPDWSNTQLQDPDDWVRREVGTALERGIHVVPVLLGGASLPTVESLPGALAGLLDRQAFEIRDRSLQLDIARLCASLPLRPSIRYGLRRRSVRVALPLFGAVIVVVALAINSCPRQGRFADLPDLAAPLPQPPTAWSPLQ